MTTTYVREPYFSKLGHPWMLPLDAASNAPFCTMEHREKTQSFFI